VGVEGASVARILGCERRHADRLRVAHQLEDLIEIASFDWTKRTLRQSSRTSWIQPAILTTRAQQRTHLAAPVLLPAAGRN